MKIVGPKIALSLYLHGSNLDPDLITALLNTKPTHQHRSGEHIGSGDTVARRKAGLWAIEPSSDSIDVKDHVELLIERAAPLLKALNDKQLSLNSLPGVEDAYLDLFIIEKRDDSQPREQLFDLPSSSIRKLADFGLPLFFTIGY